MPPLNKYRQYIFKQKKDERIYHLIENLGILSAPYTKEIETAPSQIIFVFTIEVSAFKA